MAQSGSGSSRTPFDTDLVNDPQAPRDTQPLTPRAATPTGATPTSATPAGATPAGAGLPHTAPPVASPPYSAARNLPPQVVTRGNNDDDTVPHVAPVNRPTKRLPTGTLVGFALAGGALGMVILSMIVRSALPRPTEQIVYTPEGAPPSPPRVVVQPPAAKSGAQMPQSDDLAARSIGEDAASADITIDSPPATRRNRSAAANNDSGLNSPAGVDAGNENDDADNDDAGEAATLNDGSSSDRFARQSRSSATRNNSSDSDFSGSSSASTEERVRDSDAVNAPSTRSVDTRGTVASGTTLSGSASSGGRFASRRGYAITPPAGYRLQRTGRRTVWRGPNGEQILVETGSSNGTPREGWERLDKALARKYGNKYRNRGIRETTLGGKSAAVWEFEIDTPSGTQRKIDIAVHHQGRGYAVLGQAPAARFEEARPRIEAAIRSFELQRQRDVASSTRSSSRRDNDNITSTRARRTSPAPRSGAQNNREDFGSESRRDAASNDGVDETPPVRSEGY